MYTKNEYPVECYAYKQKVHNRYPYILYYAYNEELYTIASSIFQQSFKVKILAPVYQITGSKGTEP